MPDSLWPHGLQPTRFVCPWDFSSKNKLEWVAISFSRGSCQSRDRIHISRWIFFNHWTTQEAHVMCMLQQSKTNKQTLKMKEKKLKREYKDPLISILFNQPSFRWCWQDSMDKLSSGIWYKIWPEKKSESNIKQVWKFQQSLAKNSFSRWWLGWSLMYDSIFGVTKSSRRKSNQWWHQEDPAGAGWGKDPGSQSLQGPTNKSLRHKERAGTQTTHLTCLLGKWTKKVKSVQLESLGRMPEFKEHWEPLDYTENKYQTLSLCHKSPNN